MTKTGKLLRTHRKESRISLRDTASGIGMSHVYLGKIERGLANLDPKWWSNAVRTIPTLTMEELVEANAIDSGALVVDISKTNESDKELIFAVNRAIHQNKLDKNKIKQLMEVLDS